MRQLICRWCLRILSDFMGKKFYREQYIARINKALDFIEANISEYLDLDKVAKAAAFSSFHFHRIFKALVGETVNSFIQRVRSERAARVLATSPNKSMTDIALGCGFSSSQDFSRVFKKYFDMTPSDFRNSKIRDLNSKIGKDFESSLEYNGDGRPHVVFKSLTKNTMKVEVKDMPSMSVAYVRHIGPYKGDSELFKGLFGKLCGWAGPKGLIGKDSKFLSVYYDDPAVTDEKKLRCDVCMTVPEDTEVDGEITKQVLDGGKCAVARFEIKDPSEYEDAWKAVYKDWLPESGYQPDDRPPFELYQNDPKEHPEGLHIVDICVPVKAL